MFSSCRCIASILSVGSRTVSISTAGGSSDLAFTDHEPWSHGIDGPHTATSPLPSVGPDYRGRW